VLYLFVVMLVNLRAVSEERPDPRRRSRLGFALAAGLLAELAAILMYSASRPAPPPVAGAPETAGNTEVVARLLYTDYLIPFELASVLLLVAMVGAIVLARKEA
jgi:NADH:ubiquinone oxidoreductase subunit 6 (subunit J)